MCMTLMGNTSRAIPTLRLSMFPSKKMEQFTYMVHHIRGLPYNDKMYCIPLLRGVLFALTTAIIREYEIYL